MSQCQAIVADYENGTRYNLRRAFTAPRRRQCKRSAKTEMLGPLGHTRHFCATHAGLAEEGLLTVKCGQEKCEEAATDKVFWPGRTPILSCPKHLLAVRNIGAAIGCYIHTEPLSAEESRP